MRFQKSSVATLTLLGLITCAMPVGCGREKSSSELIGDLKSKEALDKVKAARILPEHEGDAATIIPALIESLKDKSGNVRKSAALSLGNFGERAKDAVPALQALRKDPDARIREAAGKALARIDPARFSDLEHAQPSHGK